MSNWRRRVAMPLLLIAKMAGLLLGYSLKRHIDVGKAATSPYSR
jgi:hypothetical protein